MNIDVKTGCEIKQAKCAYFSNLLSRNAIEIDHSVY